VQGILVTRAIGWGSLGFALASAVAPDRLGRALGIGERRVLARTLGARDLVIGIGLVAARDPAPWLRARLAADVADAALHVLGAESGAFARNRALVVGCAAAAVAALDVVLLVRGADR
jgi:hypothetical protein